MRSINLQLPYKGNRDYLQGTAMYDETVRLITAEEPEVLTGTCRMAIHKIARNQCQLLYTSASDLPWRPENLIAEFNFDINSAHIIAWLIETREPVVQRVPYPEEQILKKCTIEGRKITINKDTPFSAIDVLVAMNKQLHRTCYPPEDGKWIFTRLETDRIFRPSDASGMQVELKQIFNNRMTKSAIVADGRSIGHIYFSLVRL